MSSIVVGGIVNTLGGALMIFVCYIARRRNVYPRKTTDALIRWRLARVEREQGVKRLRSMLSVGMGFGILIMVLGVASLVVGLR
jgi:hypothetical protein